MDRPSRIGTPDVIRVPRVRVNRATAIFRSKIPMIGILSMQSVELVSALADSCGSA